MDPAWGAGRRRRRLRACAARHRRALQLRGGGASRRRGRKDARAAFSTGSPSAARPRGRRACRSCSSWPTRRQLSVLAPGAGAAAGGRRRHAGRLRDREGRAHCARPCRCWSPSTPTATRSIFAPRAHRSSSRWSRADALAAEELRRGRRDEAPTRSRGRPCRRRRSSKRPASNTAWSRPTKTSSRSTPPLETALSAEIVITRVDAFTPSTASRATGRTTRCTSATRSPQHRGRGNASRSSAPGLETGVTWQYWGKVEGSDEVGWQPLQLADTQPPSKRVIVFARARARWRSGRSACEQTLDSSLPSEVGFADCRRRIRHPHQQRRL